VEKSLINKMNQKNQSIVKIGIPSNIIYNELISNYDILKEKYHLEIYRFPEKKISELFNQNKLDIALLNPISYCESSENGSSMVIPTKCIAMESFTGLISMEFSGKSNKISTISLPKNEEYIGLIAKIILSERYDCFPTEINNNSAKNENPDCEIIFNELNNSSSIMDLTEIWFDTYEIPLILGFWVCKSDFNKCDPIALTNELFNHEISDEFNIIENNDADKNEYQREGNIHYKWTNDIKESLNEILQMLFALGIVQDVPEIKLFGEKNDKINH